MSVGIRILKQGLSGARGREEYSVGERGRAGEWWVRRWVGGREGGWVYAIGKLEAYKELSLSLSLRLSCLFHFSNKIKIKLDRR